MSDQPTVTAGWYPDPAGRHQHRWWDGGLWTESVADDGQIGHDPLYDHAAPAAAGPAGHRSRRGPVIATIGIVLVGAVAAIALLRDDGVSPDGPDGFGDRSATITESGTVDASGGRIELATSSDGAGAVALEFPPGAVAEQTTISVTASPGPDGTLGDLAAADPSLWSALASFALDDPDLVIHPVYGPVVLAAGTELVGLQLEFGPDGQELAAPVVITVPLDLVELGSGEEPIVLHQGQAGWEVVTGVEVDVDEGVLRYPVTHFSRSFFSRILSNFVSNPAATVPIERYREALDTLSAGPIDGVVDDVTRAILCREDSEFDAGRVPPLTDVLEYLGFESQRISAAPSGAGTRIRERLVQHFEQSRAAGNDAPHDIGFDQLLGWTMDETGNDPFLALVLAHDVLRDNRQSEPVQRVLANVRGDGGDEEGARYHLLGTAVYSFAYEHQRTNENVSWWVPSPETAVQLEEAWVSGDIATDTVELAVDRTGARLGRGLYQDYLARRSGQSAADLYLNCDGLAVPDTDGEPPDPPTSSTIPPDLDLGTGDVQVTLLWAGDSDMDLHVIDPAGEEIYFSNRSSASGGQLDHDDIPTCGTETGDHAENVHWPSGSAPGGEYQAFVRFYSACETSTTSAQLTVRVDGQLVASEAVTLAEYEGSAPIVFQVG